MTNRTERIVVDTHALLWHWEKDPKLSANARTVLGEIYQGVSLGIVPTIVLAELLYIAEKRSVTPTFDRILAHLEANVNFDIVSLELRILRGMRSLTASNSMAGS